MIARHNATTNTHQQASASANDIPAMDTTAHNGTHKRNKTHMSTHTTIDPNTTTNINERANAMCYGA